MKILFKIPAKINKSKKLHLDIELSLQVSELRRRIARIIDYSLSSFHLTTKKYGVLILLSDSWPLSFFISEESQVIKIKLLESPHLIKRDSQINISPFLSSLTFINTSGSSNPLEVIIQACKLGNLLQIKEVIESNERDNQDEEYLNGTEECKWGPLHYACLAGHHEIVSYLVDKRVNCNKVSIDE